MKKNYEKLKKSKEKAVHKIKNKTENKYDLAKIISSLADQGKSSFEIHKILEDRGYDEESIETHLCKKYRSESFFHFIQLPLLFVAIFYPVFLGVFLLYSGNFIFSELSTLLAVFLIPLMAFIVIGYKISEHKLDMGRAFLFETGFVVLTSLIFFIVSIFFEILISSSLLFSIFFIFLFFQYIVSLLFHMRNAPPFHHERKERHLIHHFNFDNYLRSIGSLHLITFFILILLLGILFNKMMAAFIFIIFLVVFMKILELSYSLKSSLFLYFFFAAAMIFVILFFSIFSLIFILAFIITILILFGHRGFLSIPSHFMNLIMALVYFTVTFIFLIILLIILDSLFLISILLSPIIIFILLAVILIISFCISYYLFFTMTLRTEGKFSVEKLSWPFSMLAPSTRLASKDAILYGVIIALIILIILTLILLVFV